MIRIRVPHRFSGSKDRHYRCDSLLLALRVVERALHPTFGRHLLLVNIDRQLVCSYEVIILPGARVAGVDSHATVVMKLPVVADNVNGTLHFRERGRAVGLLLTVIRSRGLASAVG